jgi:undecaprenyl-diphosphatase
LHVTSPGGWSFPSGHAAGAVAFAVFVTMRVPAFAPIGFFYAVLVAWSRCVLGVHYPSDVLAGAAIGASIAAVFALVLRRRERTGAAVHSEGVSGPGGRAPA